MILHSAILKHPATDFDAYLSSPGLSHSFLKNQELGIAKQVQQSDKIMLGKLVDNILTDPSNVDMLSPLYNIARSIASELRKNFPYIEHFEKQVSYTGVATYNGFSIPVKGRLDYYRKDVAHIDLKITHEKNIKALIAHMGYANQMWNYAKLSGSKNNYILIYSVPLKKAFVEPIDCSMDHSEWWADKILQFGTVKQ